MQVLQILSYEVNSIYIRLRISSVPFDWDHSWIIGAIQRP